MNNIYSQAGKRIRELRELNRYTREQFAEISNISPKFLYEIETGQKGFSAETLYGISRGLGVSCEYILSGSSKKDETVLDSINLYDESQRAILDKILKLVYELSIISSK